MSITSIGLALNQFQMVKSSLKNAFQSCRIDILNVKNRYAIVEYRNQPFFTVMHLTDYSFRSLVTRGQIEFLSGPRPLVEPIL